MPLVTSTVSSNVATIKVKGADTFTRKDGTKDTAFKCSTSGFAFGTYGSVGMKLAVQDLRDLADAAEAADCDVVDLTVNRRERKAKDAVAPAPTGF